MARYLLTRILVAIPTLFGVTVVAFLMIHLIPGNVVQVMLGTRTNVTPQQIAQLYRLYGINQPLWEQYIHWIGMVVSGNFGFSLRTGLPIAHLIGQAFSVTGELAVLSLIVAVLIAVPLGMVAAIRQRTVWDHAARIISLFGFALPNFLLGTLLVLWSAKHAVSLSSFKWVSLSAHPLHNLKDMILPVAALSVSLIAIITRMTRSTVLETLDMEYVRTARSKGLGERIVILRHILRNSLVPVVTIIGLQLGYLLGGAIIVENVFSLPGLGRMIVDAITQRDYPLVQSSVLFVAVVFVLVNLVVDITYAYINPRIRYQ